VNQRTKEEMAKLKAAVKKQLLINIRDGIENGVPLEIVTENGTWDKISKKYDANTGTFTCLIPIHPTPKERETEGEWMVRSSLSDKVEFEVIIREKKGV
jgi:hypothetical protein